jgi:hypothetical protein
MHFELSAEMKSLEELPVLQLKYDADEHHGI